MSKKQNLTFNVLLLLIVSLIPCYGYASSTLLECSLTSSTSNTLGYLSKDNESNKVLLEIVTFEGTIEVHTQSPGFPIDLKISENKKEWRTQDGFVYDINNSSSSRYILERVYEDQISVIQTRFKLDRTTGELTQEISNTIGDDFTIFNVIHGHCMPTKKFNSNLF